MGVFTFESEITVCIPPKRFFKAFVLDGDNLIPKIAPQEIKQVELLEGNGGPGTVKKITFGQGSDLTYVKHKVETIDEANLSNSYSLIEGDTLGDKLEKICYETKLVPSPDGGCIIKTVSKYHTKGDVEIKEDDVKYGKEKASHLFKVIENYLNEHRDTYN